MSDGPHRSLPMRPGWKKVAEYAGNKLRARPSARCRRGSGRKGLAQGYFPGTGFKHSRGPWLNLECFWLSQSLDLPLKDVKKKLEHLLARHKNEWENFMASLGADSFVAKWIDEARS